MALELTGGEEQRPLLTTTEAAQLLKASANVIIRQFNQGKLQGHRTRGGLRRISAESVLSVAKAQGIDLPPYLWEHVFVVFFDEQRETRKQIEDCVTELLQPVTQKTRVILPDNVFEAGTLVQTVRPNALIVDTRNDRMIEASKRRGIYTVVTHSVDDIRDALLAEFTRCEIMKNSVNTTAIVSGQS
jgi:excisionase family DNA binding protein